MKEQNALTSDSKFTKILSEYKDVIALFLASRIVFLIIVLMTPVPFLQVWGQFDTEHYRYIAANGYEDWITVFFPVIPLLIRYISDVGVVILNNLAFLVSLGLIKSILKDHYNFKEASTVTGILAFSPQSFFSMLEYTESLFFLLTVIAFMLYKSKSHFLSLGLILGLSVATRNSGSMLFLAIFIGMCINWLRKEIKIVNILTTYIPATAISLIYPVFLQVRYGNWKIFMDAQMEYWVRISSNIFKTVFIQLKVIFTGSYDYGGADFNLLIKSNECLSLILFILTVVLLVLEIRPMAKAKKIDTEAAVLVLYTVFFLITIHMTIREPSIDCPTDSFYRYYAGLFPLYLMLRHIKSKTKLQVGLMVTLFVTLLTSYLFSKGIFFF